jgi:hypothetical protein
MKRTLIVLCLALLFFSAYNSDAQAINDTFDIVLGPSGEVISGGGSGFNGGFWYVYPSGWINQWFYDHPFDPDRAKIIHIEFDIAPGGGGIGQVVVAVNWSTPEWSAIGYLDSLPPVPNEAVPEETYIVREMIMGEPALPVEIVNAEHIIFDIIIWEYNPEWVSIDVMGNDVEIFNGIIVHDCVDPETDVENESWGAVKSLYR